MSVISIVLVAIFALLALATQVGVAFIERAYPAKGKSIHVTGATLNVVDIGPRDSVNPPIVMIHGASSNLEVMQIPLGNLLASTHRVILIDRPGHGHSVRERESDSTPVLQARMIAEALDELGIGHAIVVVHSWSGALGTRMALDYPERVAGLVMLAPVAYPWSGGVGWYNEVVTTPIIGPLLAYTITLPLGLLLAEPGARNVFLPQMLPHNFVSSTATPLLLRPREFLANARDLVTLKPAVIEQSPRYGDLKLPVTIIAGDVDKTVSTAIHSQPFAAAVPQTKLIVLPGVGHMVPQAAPDLVIAEIEAMITQLGSAQAAAANVGSEVSASSGPGLSTPFVHQDEHLDARDTRWHDE
jgi:pimeloyl-ACP methyl ester carboxylesterase